MRTRHICYIVRKLSGKTGSMSFSTNVATAAAADPNANRVFWRDSATLIIARPTLPLSNNVSNEIEFLVTSRSKQARFMPGGICFPGGAISPADSSNKWLDLFSKFNQLNSIKSFKCLEPDAHKPEIYTEEGNGSPSLGDDDALSREITLRITAIRETFEECGLLFCSKVNSSQSEQQLPFVDVPEDIILTWQKRVKDNPDDFITLCHEFQCLPNLSSLFEWNDWLTPITYKPGPQGKPRRFDSIFYIAVLPYLSQEPKIFIDPDEVEDYSWSTADKLIEGDLNGTHNLLPPQKYEMGRLSAIRDIGVLKELIKIRQVKGIERVCPILLKAKDGLIGCLPGDDLIPETRDIYNYSDIQHIDKTQDELTKTTKRHHRWHLNPETRDYQLLVNTHTYGHVYSLEETSK